MAIPKITSSLMSNISASGITTLVNRKFNMALHHVLVLGDYCTIRSADEGITDIEWDRGVRTAIPACDKSVDTLEALTPWEATVLSKQEWEDMIYMGRDISDEHYSSTFVQKDRWDGERKVY